MIDLNSFIKVDFLRKELSKNSTVVSSIAEADSFAMQVSYGELKNVIFETTALKEYCFGKIQELCTNTKIINCNSCLERFCENLDNYSLMIFDNINKCKDVDILSLVTNKKGILVC